MLINFMPVENANFKDSLMSKQKFKGVLTAHQAVTDIIKFFLGTLTKM